MLQWDFGVLGFRQGFRVGNPSVDEDGFARLQRFGDEECWAEEEPWGEVANQVSLGMGLVPFGNVDTSLNEDPTPIIW